MTDDPETRISQLVQSGLEQERELRAMQEEVEFLRAELASWLPRTVAADVQQQSEARILARLSQASEPKPGERWQ